MMNAKNEFYAGFYDENELETIQDEMELSAKLKKQLLMMLPIFVLLFALLLGELTQMQVKFPNSLLSDYIYIPQRFAQRMFWLLFHTCRHLEVQLCSSMSNLP
jgi:hypothetical protein